MTGFRFNLSDGTSYDLIYACYGVKNGELKSEAGGFKYFTLYLIHILFDPLTRRR